MKIEDVKVGGIYQYNTSRTSLNRYRYRYRLRVDRIYGDLFDFTWIEPYNEQQVLGDDIYSFMKHYEPIYEVEGFEV